ncbi:MAG: hypothetical protein RSC68_31235 [Acinetobacter sp.]
MEMFPISSSDEADNIGKPKENESSSSRYALIDLSQLDAAKVQSADDLIEQLIDKKEAVVLSEPGGEAEFFVLFMKDRFAYRCIEAYASQANNDSRFSNTPYNTHFTDLLRRSGLLSKYCAR